MPLRPRLALLAALALGVAACDKAPSDRAQPTPERAATSAAPAASSAAASPAPASAAPAAPSADPSAPGADPAPAADPSAAASAAAAAKADPPLPSAPRGILPKGGADRILTAGSPPSVKVLDAGAEPRAAVSYTLVKGTRTGLGMALDMSMALTAGAQKLPPATVPRMSMVLDMLTGDTNADGDFKIDARLGKVEIDPKGADQEQMATAMRPQLKAMNGLGLGYWVSPHGSVHDVKLDLPPGFPAQAQQMLAGMNQTFSSMVAPLPSAPVGVGARWRVATRVVSGGADLLQFATYTLTSRAGTRLSVDVAVTQLAAAESIQAPGLPADVSARLTSFKSGGNGSSEIDTGSVAPVSGRMSLRSVMALTVRQGATGPGEDSSVDTSIDVRFTRPK